MRDAMRGERLPELDEDSLRPAVEIIVREHDLSIRWEPAAGSPE